MKEHLKPEPAIILCLAELATVDNGSFTLPLILETMELKNCDNQSDLATKIDNITTILDHNFTLAKALYNSEELVEEIRIFLNQISTIMVYNWRNPDSKISIS